MAEWQLRWIEVLNESALRELSGSLLRSVPGLPPILQTLHLLAVAMVFASAVMLSLRVLGVAGRRQSVTEMSRRLMPWFFSALPLLLISGLPFFLARPQRYLVNPMFGIKAALFLLGLVLSLWLWQQCWRRSDEVAGTVQLKLTAAMVTVSWVMTALAGRWIAYADYIFWAG